MKFFLNSQTSLERASEFKILSKPTKPIQDVAKAVLLLRGDKSDFTLNKALKMISNPLSFLKELKEFNKEEIDDSILKKLEPILSNPYFNPSDLKSHTDAASILCACVLNILEFNTIYKRIKPLIFKK